MEKIGDTRFVVIYQKLDALLALAKSEGYSEGENLYDFVDPAADCYFVRYSPTLEMAKDRAKELINEGNVNCNSCVIEKQVLTEAHDDQGNSADGCPPEWDTLHTWEVDETGLVNDWAEA